MSMVTAVIKMKADRLDDEAKNFEMAPVMSPIFLNGVPKCGTHLLRNIFRMFTPIEQQHRREFVQLALLRRNLDAFENTPPKVSWGHMIFSDESVAALKGARHLLLVRDPYDWVLARARFYLSAEFDGPVNHIKNGSASMDTILNMMIFGAMGKVPPLLDVFELNAVAWMGTDAYMLRYEDLVAHIKALDRPEAEPYFRALLDTAGISTPPNWRERIRIGAERKHSSTASENLHIQGEVPRSLPETQRRLVDFHAPGLRTVLGYV
jgi:hypothetical protein